MAHARSWRLHLVALACLGAVVLPACTAASGARPHPTTSTTPTSPPPPPTPTPAQLQASLCAATATGPGGAGGLLTGITHTQYSADASGDGAAIASAKSTIAAGGNCLENQHLMGWGSENPEPSPGTYNFASLDARMSLVRSTGGIPVLTLCCAPDWMKGGTAGITDWSKLDVAPTPDHFQDFAALAKTVAQRYPNVLHYQVWSELKGFWNARLNRWDYEGYTAFYNLVYDALKSVNPKIQVGGPYVVLDSEADASQMSNPSTVRGVWGTLDQRSLDALTYWLDHRNGADFLAVDAGTSSKDGTLVTGEFAATAKFADLTAWLRTKTNLPVWWSEWYVVPKAGQAWSDEHKAAIVAAALARMATAGSAAALLWQPQADPAGCPFVCLWSDTHSAGGGKPTALAALWPVLAPWLAGPAPHAVAASPATVTAFATGTSLLVINTGSESVTATVLGTEIPLGAYGVVVQEATGAHP